MTVVFKGLDMPMTCAECPVFKLEYDPNTGTAERSCGVTGKFISRTTATTDRRDDCPASEILVPHGPLADLDTMRAEDSERFKPIIANAQSKEEAALLSLIHRKVQDVIDGAEWILPPEEHYECD